MQRDRIERELTIEAPIERVWSVVTTPEYMRTWLGGDQPVELDLRPGGTMVLDHSEYGRFPTTVEAVDPPHLFSFWWASAYPGEQATRDNATLVEFRLTADGDTTRLQFTESGFARLTIPPGRESTSSIESHEGGWDELLKLLQSQAQNLR